MAKKKNKLVFAMNSKEFQAMPNLKRGVGTNVQIELCS
jgi:hypothetical protein